MFGVGLLPLALVTLLWAAALRRRTAPNVRVVRGVQLLSVLALGMATYALCLVSDPEALFNSPAETRASDLAATFATALGLTAAAYGAQLLALATVAFAWLRSLPRKG